MGEQHLDLLPQLHRDVVLTGLGDVAGNLAGVFSFLAADFAGISIWTALGFGWAGLTDLLQSATARGALASRSPVRVRVIAPELLEGMRRVGIRHLCRMARVVGAVSGHG